MANAHKYVYLFSEGNGSMKELLGGKGANLAEMSNLGMPVPQGFTVSTEACTQYYNDGRAINADIQAEIMEYLTKLEEITGKKFGDPKNPLLVSVRSGARASMPGMMDTILNLGLNDTVVEGFAEITNNPRFAYDSYRRFIQMFSDVVMELSKKRFEEIIDAKKAERGIKLDTEMTTEDLKDLVIRFKKFYKDEKGVDFPTDPKTQLMEAVKAVFRSWDNPRANVYRRMNEIPYDWGTAVNVQSMVFGNSGDNSGTGVAFTRNPATGEKALFGEYLINAQGEDVVAGVRTPSPISKLHEEMPEVYDQFAAIATKLEQHYKDMQDMEFTIENGKLYMLQTRNGKRTAAAALKVAVDLVDEGMISEKEAVLRVEPKQLDSLLHPQFDPAALKKAEVIGKGLAASPGAACGKVVFTAEDAKAWHERGEKVVLVRLETSPEDIEGMQVAQGILTVRGGMTSHAAVVARGMGTCCVSGCGDIVVDYAAKKFSLSGKDYHEGDFISIDGSTGNIYGEAIATVPADVGSGDFGRLMAWADEYRQLEVYTNADTPKDAAQGRSFGAQGIGLCRTEHMFFEGERIKAMREMIVADNVDDRKKALAKIMPYQQGDFEGLYEAMEGHPVVIRFLDPPLHEFLPTKEEDIKEIAGEIGVTVEKLKNVIESLHEFNPMMGHRGCRLAVSYPEIAEMQTTAVINAAIAVTKRGRYSIEPNIMIPLVGEVKELKYVKDVVTATADKIIAESGVSMKYQVGTMIEIPRAALTADEIAKEAEFFSFGTNDLTQMTFGFSRDDAGKFLDYYYEKKIYESDPFAHLDQTGVGKLVEMAVTLGRKTRPEIHLGICGEHGGDPSSVEFCHKVGLDYVSCSPFRVPIARLAAAQAAIKNPR
ncbi:pyruvate, phosphate dikinase [Lawsonibacter faecis]|uniref:Pyruvate, phosphate dikinase n=1 Tax=Lawsonibacter faecis TaxID=2763052 RepID=A0A8J6JBF0_9FIRM|nr:MULTISPECIES: pyruvate, phosphate dikinase [Oscillospiraceae]MTQ98373.1 pyruvate, phosphate dikinase [Pseudoflavonifractor sp. BIOML-A16]MTR06070.1 pyruvate, phosphate dikinase [Pseudoflavonifractor sp. BIOML-A15]MTR74619.1 pyruvate, phosphate dikinase [Pseudoflavonifractor sp. BIOML-A18]MTS63337.1 pyruvate, phosphate dikinase [Pseudoflavonifractor sp. BIOML-A5]MTS70854.1 pyruvate, phosphate dikinase [Pseudoflavonifractor sp. BIOML-A8]MTS90275.1 pyruvate, phosphate dikinase [Pseudoflavonif